MLGEEQMIGRTTATSAYGDWLNGGCRGIVLNRHVYIYHWLRLCIHTYLCSLLYMVWQVGSKTEEAHMA